MKISASLKNKRVKKKSEEKKRYLYLKRVRKVDEYCDNVANYTSYMLGIEDKGMSMEKELGSIPEELPISLSLNPSFMCYEVSLVQIIQDRLISKSAFKEGSFHNFRSFYKKFIKDLSTMASVLVDVLKEMTGFTWQICLHLIKFVCHQVDYDLKLRTSFDLIFFFIGHIWRLDEMMNMKLIKYIHSMNHEVVHVNNKMFGMKRLVYDPRGLGWGFLGFE
ncbi:hypothetical protein M9H77_23148 [Catharanthus roseus]|uniref:Uncharacterized protein n=1 Tax=Catharanthus roseus TaxID=4058 RepID=A0ACC0AU00_CATRO|nr:hypothetical protein M9H77_23148 [Catharanthus roseus]